MDPLIHAAPPAPTFTLHEHGFTLTEMAVVLMIVALLIGGMILPMSAQQDMRAQQETEKSLAEIREALIGFAVVNGRLPRPAISATDGAENLSLCTSAPDNCNGFIPWSTLGVQKTDSWNKLIRYSVTPAYANSNFTLTTVANRTVQTRDSGGATAFLASNVPAVIFSHGKEHWGTTETGTALPDSPETNADEDANNSGPTNYFQRTPTITTTGRVEFDDLVVWLPQSILLNRMISAGRLP